MNAVQRRAAGAAIVAALLLLGGGRAAQGDAREETAKKWLKAFRAGDEAAMRAVTDDPALDPFPVADRLLAAHEKGAAADPPAPKDFLAAAAAFAERAGERAGSRALPRFVAEWTRAPREEHERDWALRLAVDRAEKAEQEKSLADALDLADKAQARAGAARPSGAVVGLHALRARVLAALGRPDDAIGARRAAAGTAEEMRWPRGKAYQLRELAVFEANRKRHEAAAAAYEEALAVSEAFGPPHAVMWTRMELAYQRSKSGRIAEALATAESALSDPEALGARGVGRTLLLLGDLRAKLGRPEEARDLYDRARAAYESAGVARDTALSTFKGGEARLALQDFAGAEERFRAAIAGVGSDEALLVAATLQLGCAVRGLGRLEEAVEIHRRAAEAAVGIADPELEPLSLAALGADQLQQGAYPAAIEALEKSLAAAARRRLPEDQLGSAHRRLAEAYRRADRPRDAVRAALRGATLRRARALDLGEAFGEDEQRMGRGAAEEGLLAALRWVSVEPEARAEATAAAFALTEAARGALLADALEGERRAAAAAPPEDGPDLRAARTRFDAAQKRVLELAFGAAAEPEKIAAARREYDAASDARREAAARADLARRADEPPPREPLSLDAAKASVPEGGLMVLYTVTPERVLAVAVSREGADLLDLGDAKPVVEAAKAWLEAVATPAGDEGPHPEALYRALLAPLEPRLKDGATLLVGRDGPLSLLPFEALATTRDGRRRRAVESWTISYVPSATVHATLARAAGAARERGPVIVLGDPVYPGERSLPEPVLALARSRGLTNLERLPASAQEARDVAALHGAKGTTLLLREEATRARLTAAIASGAGGIRLLHVACHGFADDRLPGRSGLVLSGADVLTADDVRAMRVPADLVVLSACESGGGPTRRGEGVIALARAFLEAGASRVVAADRALGDDHAREVLKAFYAARGRGLPPAAALRDAKLARLKAGGAAAHPYAWSALVLWE